MALGTPLKALAFILFIAAIAGATYGVQRAVGDTVSGQLFAGAPVHATLNATPGHAVTYAITLTNKGGSPADLVAQLDGAGLTGRAEPRTVFPGGNATVFVRVGIEAGIAEGDHPLALKIVDGAGKTVRTTENAAMLHILGPAAVTFSPGDSGNVTYTGRLTAIGSVFNTNDPGLAGANLVQVGKDNVQSPPGFTVVTSPRPSVVIGFYEGLLGMQPGESRTVSFGAEKAYGNATVEKPQERVKLVDRVETLNLPGARLSPSDFQNYLNDTKQGDAASYHVGSTLVNERNGQTLRYRIVNVSDAGYELRLDVHVGEKYTVYDFWPNASEVASVSDIDVTFKTTPTTEVGVNFTYYPYWPKMSAVTSINETTIVVTHTPPVGFRYTVSSGQGGGAQEFTVKRLTSDEIITLTPSSSPLAGKDLTFDILLETLVRG